MPPIAAAEIEHLGIRGQFPKDLLESPRIRVAEVLGPVVPSVHTGVIAVIWPLITRETGSGNLFCRCTVSPLTSPGNTASDGPGTVGASQSVKLGVHEAKPHIGTEPRPPPKFMLNVLARSQYSAESVGVLIETSASTNSTLPTDIIFVILQFIIVSPSITESATPASRPRPAAATVREIAQTCT